MSDQELSTVYRVPMHLVGMFHTPANCLHTSVVFHLCEPPVSHYELLHAVTISQWYRELYGLRCIFSHPVRGVTILSDDILRMSESK